jgi:hypothetical protein
MRQSRKQKQQNSKDMRKQTEARQAQKSDEQTQPLPNIARLTFEDFLNRYQISMLDVARAAEVRLLTIWRVMRDLPISEQQAQQVYAGLYRLAGVPYRGRIRLHPAKSDRTTSVGRPPGKTTG